MKLKYRITDTRVKSKINILDTSRIYAIYAYSFEY